MALAFLLPAFLVRLHVAEHRYWQSPCRCRESSKNTDMSAVMAVIDVEKRATQNDRANAEESFFRTNCQGAGIGRHTECKNYHRREKHLGRNSRGVFSKRPRAYHSLNSHWHSCTGALESIGRSGTAFVFLLLPPYIARVK